MRFRIVTYNIHKGIGGIDRRYDPARIVAAAQRQVFLFRTALIRRPVPSTRLIFSSTTRGADVP